MLSQVMRQERRIVIIRCAQRLFYTWSRKFTFYGNRLCNFLWLRSPSLPKSRHCWSCEIILRHSILRTPLNFRSARRRDIYLKTHKNHSTSMPSSRFEPAIPTNQRPKKRLRPRGHWERLPTFQYIGDTSISIIPLPSLIKPVALPVIRAVKSVFSY
jgi:hypothetical protein